MADVIQRLRELRQSGQSSVVHGSDEEPAEERPTVSHPLESWLVNVILEQLTRHSRTLDLVVIAGNAGDGKSRLIRSVRAYLRTQGLKRDTVDWILDATESETPSQSTVERLAAFFAPFADGRVWAPERLHVAAVNTGTAVQFLAAQEASFGILDKVLSAQLGIRNPRLDEWSDQFLEYFDRVIAVDLDRRSVIGLDLGQTQFLDRLLDSLDSGERSVLGDSSTQCTECVQRARCPVGTNLKALKHPDVRTRLKTILLDVALEDRVHVGPRGLWHLVYRLTVGGLDDLRIAAGQPLLTCGNISTESDDDLTKGLFFNALFTDGVARHSESPQLSSELARLDPFLRFTLGNHDLALVAGLASEEDERIAAPLAERLGVSTHAVCGSRTDARARGISAVRRAFFLAEDDPDPDRHGWLTAWAGVLLGCRDAIRTGGKWRDAKLQELVATVFKDMFRSRSVEDASLWQLKLPWRGITGLFTPVTLVPGQAETMRDIRVLGPDAARPTGTRDDVAQMNAALEVYPVVVPVRTRGGPAVPVTWPLFRILQRVGTRGYVAGSLDPERVQVLERLGASIAAGTAEKAGVAVVADGAVTRCDTAEGGGHYVFSA